MNPPSNERANLTLPSPSIEHLSPPTARTPENGAQSVETASSASESTVGRAQPVAPVVALPPLPPLPGSAAASPPQASSAPAANATTSVVDDGDLIEKEWVDKAKKIVENTRNDPFRRSNELTVFKADYMKKRYNKMIKLSE